MKVLLCLSVCVVGMLASPVEQEIPATNPEMLDELLDQKRYEEFSYLMNIANPEMVYSKEGDLKSREEAMFNKELSRGDIMLTAEEEAARQGLNFDRWPGNRWPMHRVPYAISNDFNRSEKRVILGAIQKWNDQVHCIKFVPRSNTDEDYVYFFSGNGCWSFLGRIGKQQGLSLNKNGCVHEGIALHEMDHAIGFHHEHNRSDRDDYIEMLWDNIPPEWRGQYEKTDPEHFGLQAHYDYYSIMHYPVYVFGTDRRAFNVKQNGIYVDERKIGHGGALTRVDLQKISELYCH